MRKYRIYWTPEVLVLSFLLCCSHVLAQHSAKTKTVGRKTLVISPTKRLPNYQLKISVDEGPKYSVSVISTSEDEGMDGHSVKNFVDGFAGSPNGSRNNRVFPDVVFEPSSNTSMVELWNSIEMFRRGGNNVFVSVPGKSLPTGKDIQVEWPNSQNEVNLKPNPLLLVLKLDSDDKLELNNETVGTLFDAASLIGRLQSIFKEREQNGVFHEGTNVIENTVTIVMPQSERKFADLITLVEAVRLPGATWIRLVKDDPLNFLVDERKPLVDVPLLPPPRKKPVKH